ncbi:hypothetical protein JYU34_018199 [Plutella xylostella]|uniref:Zinc finger protein n=1 Tax=Plutella xylostella TaxID=51655 RepID=A0ABQ7Q1E3_PLUXY|nr:hypothetical protein JYU34_018199 [Plutella xylostella]
MKVSKGQCCKCASTVEDGVTLYRFPKPGLKNALRCELWAKFYAPDRNWASTELQNQLHSQHKMLCSKHFESSMFYDKTKLVRHAVPNQSNCDIKVEKSSPNTPSPSPRPSEKQLTMEHYSDSEDKKPYEGIICICCMATENLEELFAQNNDYNSEYHDYASMIQSGLNIQLSAADGHSSICRTCADKVTEVVFFKQQILNTVSLLTSVNDSKLTQKSDEATKLKIHVKIEAIDSDDLTSGADDDDDGDKNGAVEHIDEKPAPNQKRKVGRPRKFPKTKMPYKIGAQDRICRECNLEFPNNLILKRHYNTHFPNFKCTVCLKSFMNSQSLTKHERVHLTGPFECNVCHKEYSAYNSLMSHKRRHKKDPLFKCNMCNIRFATIAKRVKHLELEHGVTEKRYKCEYCDMAFRHSEERHRHITAKHHRQEYRCPVCDFRSTQSGVRAHLANIHGEGEKKHRCDTCDKTFWRRQTLVLHCKSHFNERSFKCKLCSKSFVQKVTLCRHIEMHIKKGEFTGHAGELVTTKESEDTGMLEERLDEEYLDESCSASSEIFEKGTFEEIEANLDLECGSDFEIEALDEWSLNSNEFDEIEG